MSAEAAGQSLVGERVGSYRIAREIARGGMGVVYEAVHDRLGQRAAVKVLTAELAQDPAYNEFVDRFFDEARAITVIQHPGIVRITDYGQMPSGIVYILMEFLEGESLWHRVSRQVSDHGRGMPAADALRYSRQIASAVAAAHKKGILHRDLKLANVLLVPDPEAVGAERTKLIDFGIARFLDSPYRRTAVGTIMGTPEYMSPEQCLGKDVDAKSDVYALGIMLYEMLTGAPPFTGAMQVVLVRQVQDEPPPLRSCVEGLPELVHHLVHSMLAKDPMARPSMEQVVSRVQQWEAEQSRRSAPQPVIDADATRMMPEVELQRIQALAAEAIGPPTRPDGAAPPQGRSAQRPQVAPLFEGEPTRMSPKTIRDRGPRPVLLYVGGGGALVMLLGVVLWLAMR